MHTRATDLFSAVTPGDAPVLLVVDDDELVRRVERAVLARAGYAVEEACNGAHALARIKNGLRPDLILADLVMPGISGEVLAARIRAVRPDQKFLFVTGYAVRLQRLRPTLKRAEIVFLDKPFTSAALLDAVAGLLGRPSEAYEGEPGAVLSVVV